MAIAVSPLLGLVLLLAALVAGPLVATEADRGAPKLIDLTVSATRLVLVAESATTRRIELPLAALADVEVIEGGLVLRTADAAHVVRFPGQGQARLAALEALIEGTRERMRERAGTADEVPAGLRAIRARDPWRTE